MSVPHIAISRLMPIAVATAGLLVVAGAGLFYYATQIATGPERVNLHKVTVGRTTCDPADFTVPAGLTTFEIHNASDRTLEWEILDGVMVVEERENIAPGFHSFLTAKLRPGTYDITCGLLSNPRGRLVVTPSAQSDAERAAPPISAFIGPLSEFKVYIAIQSNALVKAVESLSHALESADLEAARSAWLAARLPYKRLELVASRMADLENAIDPLSDYLEKRENDPGFTGFHRIEYGLWAKNSTDGLLPVAQQMTRDVTALQQRLRDMKLAPADLADNAMRQTEHLAQQLETGQTSQSENRWSGSDLADIAASLDGIAKSSGELISLVKAADPKAAEAYSANLESVRAAIADTILPGEDAYPALDQLEANKRAHLNASLHGLAEAIGGLNAAIGLE